MCPWKLIANWRRKDAEHTCIAERERDYEKFCLVFFLVYYVQKGAQNQQQMKKMWDPAIAA